MYFDTHTHVNFSAYKQDADETIKRAQESGTWLINVGTQIQTSTLAVEMAKEYAGVYAAIGLHPVHTWQQMLDEEESHFKTHEESFDPVLYRSILSDKVVAIGECGLDYFRLPKDQDPEIIKNLQKKEFIKQISFAKENDLPLIIHCRDAYADLLDILKHEGSLRGVIHSFTDTWETAKKFLDLGYYIAFNGILTFDKTGKLAEVVKNAPTDRILIETDAPYLTPPPFRGKRNEPAFVLYIAEKIAEIKGISSEEAAQLTFNNACELFKIKTPA